MLAIQTEPVREFLQKAQTLQIQSEMLTLQLIHEAAARIRGHVHRTPVLTSRSFNEATGKEVFFKCENLQRAGAFKIRGATNKILSLTNEEQKRGVAAFSSGNHAQAVALASREAGVRAVIAMPDDAPKAKVAATRGYGAEIIFYDRLRQDREDVAIEIAERDGRVMVPPYDDYLILAGQGTCGIEFLEEVPDLDCVLAPCSGGGLFAGVSTAAKAINPEVRCFPVEPESADDTRQSFRKGERVSISPPPTIADGLRVQSPGTLTFPILQKNAEDVLTVSDEEIVETIKFFLFRMKLLVEPSGAAAAAAVFTDKLPRDTKRVGVIISGGNIDGELLTQFLLPK
jgi:threonine dehydratase